MKLCFIANPTSTHTRRWITWMMNRGHNICLIADTPLIDPWPDIPVYNLPAKMNLPVIRFLFWELWVQDILRSWKPEILHAHRVSSAGLLGAFSGFHPYVVTPWGSDLYLHPTHSRYAGWLARRVMKTADLVTADSYDLCQKAIDFGSRIDSTYVIQWGVDTALFRPGEAPDNLRRKLGLENGHIILSPRGLNPIYNIDTIIKSIPLIRQVFPDAIFLLRKYNVDPVYQIEMENLILALDLAESLRWVGRIEPWEQYVDYYRLATIVVSVPSSDSTAVSILEAMACGVPVIASDLPSTREWIVDGVNGSLIPVRDPDRLAEATIQLLQNSRKRAEFANKNLALVHEKASHQLEMEKMEQLYFDLITQEKRL